MNEWRTARGRLTCIALQFLSVWLPACSSTTTPSVEELPTPSQTLREVGRRLSARLSIQELEAAARSASCLLTRLTSTERDALARGALRFQVDRPVTVEVVVPAGPIPFWLAERGFTRVAEPIVVNGARWDRYQKPFPAGWVGLGVNGLDRTPKRHYIVFVRSIGPAKIRGIAPDHWRDMPAQPGQSVALGLSETIGSLPEDLRGATLLQPSHDQRHAAILARGRVWKTHVVSGRTPDQVTVAFGSDSARSLVWTWRTRPEACNGSVRLARCASTVARHPIPRNRSASCTRARSKSIPPTSSTIRSSCDIGPRLTASNLIPPMSTALATQPTPNGPPGDR